MPEWSEVQLQGQLEGPGTALLKQRHQTAEGLIQHSCGTEIGRPELDISKGIREVRMVEKIKGVGAKLQIDVFAYWEFSSSRKVHLCQAKAGNVIPAFRSLSRS